MPTFFDSELAADFEVARVASLRRRFLWLTGLAVTGSALGLYAVLTRASAASESGPRIVAWLRSVAPVAGGLQLAILLIPFGAVALGRGPATRRDLLRLVGWIVAVCTFLQLPFAPFYVEPLERLLNGMTGANMHLGFGVPVLLSTLGLHLVACLLMPWTPREAVRPVLPVLSVYVFLSILEVARGRSDVFMFGAVLATIAVAVGPGLLVCFLRYNRFRERFEGRAYRDRYEQIAAELDVARRIHERLFPAPIRYGDLTLDYVYEPMRAIGGDFLFARRSGEGPGVPLHIAIIDVTGHGIAAALAVNRLHGELERILGVHADPRPGTVLRELNRYVNLTMSAESIFATAICLRVDPGAERVAWASAAHPPAYIRCGAAGGTGGAGGRGGAGGAAGALESTAVVLGALPDAEFDPAEQEMAFRRGESILAYTDGCFEVRRHDGKMIGLKGLEAIASRSFCTPMGWPAAVHRAIQAERAGPLADDTLIVQIART